MTREGFDIHQHVTAASKASEAAAFLAALGTT